MSTLETSSGESHHTELANIWREVVTTKPFNDPMLGTWLRSEHQSDKVPQPGYVGRRYRPGGTILIGMNPGRGKETPFDELYYDALRVMARPDENALEAFDYLNQILEDVTITWRFYEILVQPILKVIGLEYSDIAYLNLLKWRTKKGVTSKQFKALYKRSWETHTRRQIEALAPSRIIVLGIGAGEAFASSSQVKFHTVIPRVIGDYKISERAKIAIDELRREYATSQALISSIQ